MVGTSVTALLGIEPRTPKIPDGVADSDIELSAPQVQQICGGCSSMTLWRWIEYRGFPAPHKRCGRNYWTLAEIRAWRARQDREAANAPAA